MSKENVELVRRMYDAYAEGDFETALSSFDPEIEWDVTMRPEGEIYRGYDGIAEALRTWTGAWEGYAVDPEELIDAGQSVIVVERQSGRGRGSGVELSQHYYAVYSFRGDRVARAKWFLSREEAFEAAGSYGRSRSG